MKRELIIYTGLILTISILFSFEFMVKTRLNDLPTIAHEATGISTISFDVPANVYFMQGDENKIIIEGSSFILDQLILQNKLDHFELKRENAPSLFGHLLSLISPDPTINMYVIAENIENINILNQNGCIVKNGLFNEDRGIMKVDGSDIIQFTKSKNADHKFIQSCYYIQSRTQSFTSCL